MIEEMFILTDIMEWVPRFFRVHSMEAVRRSDILILIIMWNCLEMKRTLCLQGRMIHRSRRKARLFMASSQSVMMD